MADPDAHHFDDAAALDGLNGGNIFDIEDVFDPDQMGLEGEEMGEVSTAPETDDFVPDNDLGAGDPNGPLIHYRGEDGIDGIPSRDDLVAAHNTNGLSERIRAHADSGKGVFFMPADVEETNEYRHGAPVYALRLYGAMMDGSKAEVTLTDIPVYFDVRVPDRGPGAAAKLSPAGQARLAQLEPGRVGGFDSQLREIVGEAGGGMGRIEHIEAYPIRGYHTAPQPYRRLHFANLQQRKKALTAVRAAGFETASDDRSSYYRKAARELGLPLSDWAILGDYEFTPGPTDRSPLCKYIFRAPVASYKPLIDTLAPKAKRDAAVALKAKNELLTKDRTLVVDYDIETHSKRKKGDVPDAQHDGDNAFMICLTAHWKDDPEPLAQICLVDVETAPDSRWITVVCGTPENVLRAFALTLRTLAPDVIFDFNGSEYDWPFIVEKTKRLGMLGWFWNTVSAAPRRTLTDEAVMKWNFRRQKIKISAEETFNSSYLKYPGCVPIDVRVCFKKLYPKSETPKAGSLRFYLEISGLPAKADMPVPRMWRYYEEALETEGEPDARAAEQMRHVAHYCIIDSISCQRLVVRRNIINDYREVSSLAFVSLNDSHYYAGGMKVCNLLGAYAARRNILISMIPAEQAEAGKYPGAYVFPPEKGISPNADRLADIDAAAAELREAAAGGADTGRVAKATARIREAFAAFASDRPVTGLDFASLYPSLIMTYNLSPEKIVLTPEEAEHWRVQGRAVHQIEFMFNGRLVRGWAIRHNNVPEDIGLYPSVLIDLFNKRADLKLDLARHAATKELIELIFSSAKKAYVLAQIAKGTPKATAEKDALRRALAADEVAEAVQRVLADAEAEKAATDAALAPDAPPIRVSPGATLIEEVNDLKRRNKNAKEQIEGIRKLLELAGKRQAANPAEALHAAILAEYADACFRWTGLNAKQAALKVYMNTFYGEAGNSLSAFFLLQLAGGVTSAGQYNIKLVADFVRSKGFRIKYGDTDSLYLVAPDKYFEECDADYAAGRINREEWWSAMVRITMRALNQIRDEVNAFLKKDNGSGYLKMAYEEVLYPVVFTGKKKYFGIPHLNEVNFRPKKLFIKGIDVVKQGQPGLAIEIGHRIMWACMALDNRRSLRQVVEDVLRDAVVNGAQWNFGHFVKTDAWKPEKNNVSVQRFIARMKARHAAEVAENEQIVARGGRAKPYLYEIPEPGERFSYVMVKTGEAFNLRGCKADPKKGDMMEFARAAKALGIEVNVADYMIRYIIGLCARFINGDPEFQPPAAVAAKSDDKQIDKMSQTNAKKMLEKFIKGLSNMDGSILRSRGYAYRRAYRNATKIVHEELADRVGGDCTEILQGSWLSFELFGDEDGADPAATVVNNCWQAAAQYAEAIVATDGEEFCRELGLLLGIEANGSDSHPGSRAGSRPASPPPAAKPTPNPAPAPKPAPKLAPTPTSKLASAPTPTSRPAPAAKRAPAPATTLYGATRAPARGRPTGATIQMGFTSVLTKLEAATRDSMAKLAPSLIDVAARYEADLARLVHHFRIDEHAMHPDIGAPEETVKTQAIGADPGHALTGINEADRQVLLEFRRLWYAATAIQITNARNLQFSQYLLRLKNKRLGISAAPAKKDVAKIIEEAASKLRITGATL